ncbi:uncharacterized protein BXZ73DRAFT_72749 [Epithele typhae]|uniref:uncharacterized protein n=1 Tax=Epithele typhae TaxID=378194 RepID=UPI002008E4A5|nr:uncharacterized protein BXZ73DRAFT_72749 [Epithele typhae]KAH9945826.1 hypothetical protein BXZ73DRAFT_72749 [Epithele typhae]
MIAAKTKQEGDEIGHPALTIDTLMETEETSYPNPPTGPLDHSESLEAHPDAIFQSLELEAPPRSPPYEEFSATPSPVPATSRSCSFDSGYSTPSGAGVLPQDNSDVESEADSTVYYLAPIINFSYDIRRAFKKTSIPRPDEMWGELEQLKQIIEASLLRKAQSSTNATSTAANSSGMPLKVDVATTAKKVVDGGPMSNKISPPTSKGGGDAEGWTTRKAPGRRWRWAEEGEVEEGCSGGGGRRAQVLWAEEGEAESWDETDKGDGGADTEEADTGSDTGESLGRAGASLCRHGLDPSFDASETVSLSSGYDSVPGQPVGIRAAGPSRWVNTHFSAGAITPPVFNPFFPLAPTSTPIDYFHPSFIPDSALLAQQEMALLSLQHQQLALQRAMQQQQLHMAQQQNTFFQPTLSYPLPSPATQLGPHGTDCIPVQTTLLPSGPPMTAIRDLSSSSGSSSPPSVEEAEAIVDATAHLKPVFQVISPEYATPVREVRALRAANKGKSPATQSQDIREWARLSAISDRLDGHPLNKPVVAPMSIAMKLGLVPKDPREQLPSGAREHCGSPSPPIDQSLSTMSSSVPSRLRTPAVYTCDPMGTPPNVSDLVARLEKLSPKGQTIPQPPLARSYASCGFEQYLPGGTSLECSSRDLGGSPDTFLSPTMLGPFPGNLVPSSASKTGLDLPSCASSSSDDLSSQAVECDLGDIAFNTLEDTFSLND